jgi:hypothetical protein
MNSEEKTLALFETRVRQLMFRFNELKEENIKMQTEIDGKDTVIKQTTKELEDAKQNYDSLMMAKMIEISNGDMENAKSKLSKLIRDVNKCIALLRDEK